MSVDAKVQCEIERHFHRPGARRLRSIALYFVPVVLAVFVGAALRGTIEEVAEQMGALSRKMWHAWSVAG